MSPIKTIIIVLLLANFLLAETFFVSPCQSIQQRIQQANDGDTVIVLPGIYRENIDFLGKAITVTSLNPSDPNLVAHTLIDGSQSDDANRQSVVTFRSGEKNDSVLIGLTLSGGRGTWLPIAWDLHAVYWNLCGGGIVCYNMSEPTISHNIIRNNTAGQGGGVYVYGDPVNASQPVNPPYHLKPIITSNTIIHNQAIINHGLTPPDALYQAADHGDGGAFVGFQGVDAILANNVMAGNYADAYGGGIHVRQWSHARIENNLIKYNSSLLGAGIHITYNSDPLILRNVIKGNSCGPGGGGGIYGYYQSNPQIIQNEITLNSCQAGAGIALYFSSGGLISNNLIHNNLLGAGIRVRGSSSPVIIHNTITGNQASADSGGIDCTYDSNPLLSHNLIAGNGGYGIYCDEFSLPQIQYNDVWNHPAGNYGPALTDQTGLDGNISADPRFEDNIGQNYRLSLTSPCLNAGLNQTLVSTEDLYGNPRLLGPAMDIGAHEAWPVVNISRTLMHQSLQQALDQSQDGDTIICGRGHYLERLVFPNWSVTLQSTNPLDDAMVRQTMIDAAGTGPVITIAQGHARLSGFTITGGLGENGGGLAIESAAGATIEYNRITGNTARQGGGFYLHASPARIQSNLILNNRTLPDGNGAGGFIQDGPPDNPPIIVNNNFAGNQSGQTGGLALLNTAGNIYNNTIVLNRGIGLAAQDNPVYNCIIYANDPNDLTGGQLSCCFTTQFTPGTGNLTGNPFLANPGRWDDNQTPGNPGDDLFLPGNYHLRPESPCIDAGLDPNFPVEFDINGDIRLVPGNTTPPARIDIGADEFCPNLITDLNDDGQVDLPDLVMLAGQWLNTPPGPEADFNQDGRVDLLDYTSFSLDWFWQARWKNP